MASTVVSESNENPQAMGPQGQAEARGSITDITPEQFAQLTPADATIVDVREHVELAIGVVPRSINIPLGTLGEHMNKIPQELPVAVYCRSGGRSARAAELLASRGYTVLNLVGGYTAFADYLAEQKRVDDQKSPFAQ